MDWGAVAARRAHDCPVVRFEGHPAHVHEEAQVIYVVLGAATVVLEGAVVQLGESEGLWVPGGMSHAVTLEGQGVLLGPLVEIDPPDLAEVDREYLLVQGELYPGEPGDAEQTEHIRAGRPQAWMFNGAAMGYDHAPLVARVDERVRVWVVTAGPLDGTSFHVVGGQFDTVYAEGAYRLQEGRGPLDGGTSGGAQALALAPAQGGFVELVVPEAGHYPFVSHVIIDAERGASGILQVND